MVLDCNHPNPHVQKRLEAIYGLHTKKMDFRLDKGPYIDLLASLGNPQLNLPPVIHIAGTNGKGSTLAFLKSIYERAGLRVHAYTSPHLLKFNERIQLAGYDIGDDRLIHYLDLITETNDGARITFFEFTTAMAIKAFADNPADICLLETGLGGRLDCTNIVPNPIATIITSIGYDHMDWLGHEINDIAAEKAGIMKSGAPCFVAPQRHDIAQTLTSHAEKIECAIHFIERMNDLPDLSLVGDHQLDNASVAVKTVKTIHPNVAETAIIEGLGSARWPARMEKISNTPEIWFDCGHNSDGAYAIATQLKHWKKGDPSRKINLILGLAADKNPDDFLAPMMDYIDHITCVDLPNARNPQTAKDLADKITIFDSVKTANSIDIGIVNNSKSNEVTLVTGSLYLYEQIKHKI